jgi:Multicopper oxidase
LSRCTFLPSANTLPIFTNFQTNSNLRYKSDGVEFPSVERAAQNGGLDPISRAFPAEIGEVIDIVLLNTGADSGGLDAHPWHAHGRHYWDLGGGNGSYDAEKNEALWAGKEPAVRDTVSAVFDFGKIFLGSEARTDDLVADDAL